MKATDRDAFSDSDQAEYLYEKALTRHEELWHTRAQAVGHAPATYSLIGEHTDRFGGVVLMGLSHQRAAVAVSARDDQLIAVDATTPAGRLSGQVSWSALTEVARASESPHPGAPFGADAEQPGPRVRAGDSPADPGAELALEVSAVLWSMIHRQLASRELTGLSVTIASEVPEGVGLGSGAAVTTALAVGLAQLDPTFVDDPPTRTKIAEALSASSQLSGQHATLRARYFAALRGQAGKLAVIDYADNSVAMIEVPSSANYQTVLAYPTRTYDAAAALHVLHRQDDLIARAEQSFSVPSLRQLPDAAVRVAQLVAAVHEVLGEDQAPGLKDTRAWLGFWDRETRRAQQAARALRTQNWAEFLDVLNESQADITASYGLPGAGRDAPAAGLAKQLAATGVRSVRCAAAGLTQAVLAVVSSPILPAVGAAAGEHEQDYCTVALSPGYPGAGRAIPTATG